jgi:hypothetical protein
LSFFPLVVVMNGGILSGLLITSVPEAGISPNPSAVNIGAFNLSLDDALIYRYSEFVSYLAVPVMWSTGFNF